MLDLSVSTGGCEDVGRLCTYITCCNECAQTGASYLVCYNNDLGVCGSIECRVDGTSSTNLGGIGNPAVNPGGTSGAVTNTGGDLTMLSIAALYYVA